MNHTVPGLNKACTLSQLIILIIDALDSGRPSRPNKLLIWFNEIKANHTTIPYLHDAASAKFHLEHATLLPTISETRTPTLCQIRTHRKQTLTSSIATLSNRYPILANCSSEKPTLSCFELSSRIFGRTRSVVSSAVNPMYSLTSLFFGLG